MELYEIILLSLAGLLLILIGIILVRTFSFNPPKHIEVTPSTVEYDKERALLAFSDLIKCKTVSYYDKNKEDELEFEKLFSILPKHFPKVFEVAEKHTFKDRGLLLKIKGESDKQPTVLMAHFDVVPVTVDKWTKNPFGADIVDGVLYGRGAVDTKVTFSNSLFAVNTLLEQGFTPKNDIYLAYSGSEEIMGEGALEIVKYLKENNVTPALVLDEGGAVVKDVFPGVKTPCGLIGIAEKGMIDIEYKIDSNGGHASAPKPHTPIGELSKAVCKVEDNPFPFSMTAPVKEMFNTLGRYSTFVYKMIFSNLWLFKGVLNKICKKSGGDINALLRTTVAFTQSKGSEAPNVIPPTATVVSNSRILPDSSVEYTLNRIKKTVNNPNIKFTKLNSREPSKISTTNCEGYERIKLAIEQTWQDVIVSPYLMVQCSDSRYYDLISNKVYRFSSVDLTKEERASVHGNDERIRLESFYRSVEFYLRLVKNS